MRFFLSDFFIGVFEILLKFESKRRFSLQKGASFLIPVPQGDGYRTDWKDILSKTKIRIIFLKLSI